MYYCIFNVYTYIFSIYPFFYSSIYFLHLHRPIYSFIKLLHLFIYLFIRAPCMNEHHASAQARASAWAPMHAGGAVPLYTKSAIISCVLWRISSGTEPGSHQAMLPGFGAPHRSPGAHYTILTKRGKKGSPQNQKSINIKQYYLREFGVQTTVIAAPVRWGGCFPRFWCRDLPALMSLKRYVSWGL